MSYYNQGPPQHQPPYGQPPPPAQGYGGYGQQQPQQPAYGGGYSSAPAPPPAGPQYGQQPSSSYGSGPPPPPPVPYGQAPTQQHYGGGGASSYGYGAPSGPPPPPMMNGGPAYGGPPPPAQAPAQAQYGGGYQQPQPGYGAPPAPQTGYGAPPPPVPAAAPHPGGIPMYLGARLAVDPLQPYAQVPASLPGYYDPSQDVEVLKKAMKGFGTNESALNKVICVRSADQIQVLNAAYQARHGKSLIDTVKKETSGYYEDTLVSCLLGPVEFDVELLQRACAGPGTKELLLTEIIISRTPAEMMMLRATYEKRYKKSMDQVVLGELSMKTRDAFGIALQGRHTDNGYVDPGMLNNDTQQLKSAYRLGYTDEMLIASVIFARSPKYLQALCHSFQTSTGHSLPSQIQKHFSFHLQDALLYAVGVGQDGTGVLRDAEMLEKAMAGAGTKDQQLIWRIVRAHWERPRFEAIKAAYQAKYRTSLASRVKGETSGHYENALVAVIEGR